MSFHLKLNFLVQIFGGVVRFDLDSDGFEGPLRGRGQFSVRILVLCSFQMTFMCSYSDLTGSYRGPSGSNKIL